MSKLEWLISKLSRRARWRLSYVLDHISGMCVDGDVQRIADLGEAGKISEAGRAICDLIHETGVRDHRCMVRMIEWLDEWVEERKT